MQQRRFAVDSGAGLAGRFNLLNNPFGSSTATGWMRPPTEYRVQSSDQVRAMYYRWGDFERRRHRSAMPLHPMRV